MALSVVCGGGGSGSGSGGGSTVSTASVTASAPNSTSNPYLAISTTGLTDYVQLFSSATKVTEQVQYSEPDGTLVTYAGSRPTDRHACEGGEEWTSLLDLGPGDHFSVPTFYFQNRICGLVIRDEVPAGRQSITIYLKPNVGTFINNGFSAFRRLDAGVIEYGWKMGVGFDNKKEGNQRCHAADKIEALCSAQPIKDYCRSA
jgi:hypothetical protein